MSYPSQYGSPRNRLLQTVNDSAGPEDCWEGTIGAVCSQGYNRMKFYVPGLRKQVYLTTHVLMWVAEQTGLGMTPAEMDDLYLAYLEFRHSGLEIDHKCVNSMCRQPLHLHPVTRLENERLKRERRAEANMAKAWVRDVDPEPLPF